MQPQYRISHIFLTTSNPFQVITLGKCRKDHLFSYISCCRKLKCDGSNKEMSFLELAEASAAQPSRSDDFWVSVGVAVLMMFVTEIGDKTFIIAAVFGSVKERLATVAAVECTMALMVLVSVTSGDVAINIAGAGWVNVAALTCYALFGVMFFRDAWYNYTVPPQAMSQGMLDDMPIEPTVMLAGKNSLWEEWLDVFWKVGVCTFFSEWADRTQFSVFRLSNDYNQDGVVVGCLLGQALCTVIAVLGGRYLMASISPRKTLFLGGVIFLCLGVYIYFWNPGRQFVTSK